MRRDGRAYKRDRADGEPKPLQYKNAPDTRMRAKCATNRHKKYLCAVHCRQHGFNVKRQGENRPGAASCLHVAIMPWAVEPTSTMIKTSASGCQDCDETLDAAATHKKMEQSDSMPIANHTTCRMASALDILGQFRDYSPNAAAGRRPRRAHSTSCGR